MALLSTEDSNDSQKRMHAVPPNPHLSVLFTHPTPVSPCLAQRGSDMQGSTVQHTALQTDLHYSVRLFGL